MQYWRNVFFGLISLGVAAIFQWGPRFLVGSQQAREESMGLLNKIDEFLRTGWSPTLVIFFLALAFSVGVISPLSKWFMDKVLNKNMRKFNKQFYDRYYQKLRQDFAWNLEAAYQKYNKKADKNTHRDLIDSIEFPEDFPPAIEIGNYADNIQWPNEAGKELWPFYKTLFSNMLEKQCEKDLIPSNRYEDFLEGRRVTAQFWDTWSREILNGNIQYRRISRQTDANMRAIRAIAISELAVATVYHWDIGAGKTPLFKLAKEGAQIAYTSLIDRWRAWLAAKIQPGSK